jgi:hypothetical protein
MPRASNQGGKQPGAGRKPGNRPQNRNLTPFRNRPETDYPDIEDRPEPPPHIRAGLALVARGLSKSEVGRRVNRQPAAIYKWIANYPDVLEQEVLKLVDPSMVFAPMVPHAARAYHQALEMGDTSVAKDVFDRQYGKPVVRTISDSRSDIRITIFDGAETIEG